MNPVYQTVVNVDMDNATCMVKSARGNIYPADINRLNKTIAVNDEALVTKGLDGGWVVVDVKSKYPAPLDVTEFPRDENNCLDIIAHSQYLQIIKGKSESERVQYDNHLLKLFIEDYGMKNTLKHRYSQLGYEVSSDMEPDSQSTLEDY